MNEQKSAQCRQRYAELLPNLADYVQKYAAEKGDACAIIEHNTGEKISWKAFDKAVNAFAAKLLSIGLQKGDVVATSLPLLKEHVYLMYACHRVGLIIAPLDLRLKTSEIQYCLDKIKPKAYFFLGKTPVADFRPMIEEVMKASPYVRHWVQFQKEPELVLPGAVGIAAFVKDIKWVFIKSLFSGAVKKARAKVGKRDACLIIFTTGSTGSPKPGLLCHENILIQNVGLLVAFDMVPNDRMLVNLPPSHVGCVTEQLDTTIVGGGTCVILHIFDPVLSLEAIQQHKVTTLGQIPALFNLEWRLPDYAKYDISSLRFAIYGGQSVSREFLEKLQAMAPTIGTGLGLTETAGFCSYTEMGVGVDSLAQGIGFASPLCPITVREPMTADGYAGAKKAPDAVGEICLEGPQVFLGYLGDPANTAKTISKDGVLYTGDLGFYDQRGLHFAGRSKMVIKPKGYQVFPEDLENHIAARLKGLVTMVAAVGAEHEVFSEGIVVFVEKARPDVQLTVKDVLAACDDISAYSRPSHVVVVDPEGIPLNRVAKTDYLNLKARAKQIVEELRAKGGWDAN